MQLKICKGNTETYYANFLHCLFTITLIDYTLSLYRSKWFCDISFKYNFLMLSDQQRKICCYCARSKTSIPTNSRKYVKETHDFIIIVYVNFHMRNNTERNEPILYLVMMLTVYASVPYPMLYT